MPSVNCPVCASGTTQQYLVVSGVDYHECLECECLFADPTFMAEIEAGAVQSYQDDYWKMEIAAARERSFGSSLNRVAEIFLYARQPIHNFIDVGSGPGFLLDSLAQLMPMSHHVFHAIELFPPPIDYRTRHPNYVIGQLKDMPHKFQAGSCVEVIEHLTPKMLEGLVQQLSEKSDPGAIYYFGSGQPAFVKNENQSYLDPHIRGHIMSYSTKSLAPIFAKYGFNVIPLPGRTWAFLAEAAPPRAYSVEELLHRIWTAVPENVAALKDKKFGPLMYIMGIESARCYFESALCAQRTSWALSLQAEKDVRR